MKRQLPSRKGLGRWGCEWERFSWSSFHTVGLETFICRRGVVWGVASKAGRLA